MNICKAALTVAKRHWAYIVLYLIGLSLVMTTMLVQSVSKSNGSSPSFSPSRSTVAIVDRDGDAGGIATGLRDYLAQSNNIVHVDDNTLCASGCRDFWGSQGHLCRAAGLHA